MAEGIDVAEIYSPPRATKRAEQWGLKGGWGLDLTAKDNDGKPWDFSSSTMRSGNKINKDTPLLIAGSSTCTVWSAMMNLNWPRTTAEERARRTHKARKHLRFYVKMNKLQISEGRYCLHEHPVAAKSWQEPKIKAMLESEHNILTRLDQCQCGLCTGDKEGWLLAKKPTKFITNSLCIA